MFNPKIIAVDDEIINLSIIKILLAQEEFEVTVCTTPEECLEIISKECFDVALLDIIMSGMDGYELCREIKSIYPDIFVVFLTAIAEDEAIRKSFNCGGFDYIAKPIRKAELIARINNALRVKNAESSLKEVLYELSDKNKFLEEQAITDGLTGLFNHRHVMEQLRLRLAEAQRYFSPLSIIMFDIDYFKSVNDNYGHQLGDEVLIDVATRLRKTLREVDIVGRYGGEEFLVILPNTNIENSKIVAEKLRAEVEKIKFSEHEDFYITISGGVCALTNEKTARELIKKADSLLYRAKNKGRNKIEF